jgi:hypothetical protein
MAAYTFEKAVFPETLHLQLSVLPGFDGLSCTPTQVTVMFLNDLSPSDLTVLNGIVESHNSEDLTIVVRRKIEKAKILFERIATEFSTENVLMGITQAGKTKLIADTLKDVFYYGQTGSLYECLAAIDAIVITPEMSPFLTEDRRAILRQRVLDVLLLL